MKHDIPIPCPRCSGKMYAITYDVIIRVLKPRSWQVCKNCDYSRDADDFKKELLTV